ncbi:ribokinase [Xylanimonas sp. McL0601]|uniref:ribokinase n=1 Tax=Xylanimonas sp. McL0601 TaxID=3414739 RepID=UPI003CF982CF
MSAPSAASSIVVVGSVNADLIARVAAHPSAGETALGESMTVLAGGKGANQAVAASRLGSRVAILGSVGDDAFAAPATGTLKEAGVDLSALRVTPGPTGIAMIVVAADGENSIVVVPGANAAVDGGFVGGHAEKIAAASVVVVSCEIPRDGVEAAARAATGRVVLNLAPVIELDPKVVRLADPLVVNEHEARGALTMLGGAAVGTATGHADVARALVAAGVRSVVVTLGAAGALVATADGVVVVQAPRVTAVDTTGAGDAFIGALAHRLAAGDELDDAARFAVRVGAYAVTKVGAQASYPDARDLLPSRLSGPGRPGARPGPDSPQV